MEGIEVYSVHLKPCSSPREIRKMFRNHKRTVDFRRLPMYEPLKLAISKVAKNNDLTEEVVERGGGLVYIILKDKNGSNGKTPNVMRISLNKKVPRRYITIRSVLPEERVKSYWDSISFHYGYA